MIGEEKIKQKLTLAYKINILYLKLMASISDVSVLTGVPIASIKRYLNMLGERTNDYLRLLPDLGDEETFLEIQSKVNQQKEQNMIDNKWMSSNTPLDMFQEEIQEIKNLYEEIKPLSDEEIRENIRNLQVDGLSLRKIAQATGVSLGRVHKILNTEAKKAM